MYFLLFLKVEIDYSEEGGIVCGVEGVEVFLVCFEKSGLFYNH